MQRGFGCWWGSITGCPEKLSFCTPWKFFQKRTQYIFCHPGDTKPIYFIHEVHQTGKQSQALSRTSERSLARWLIGAQLRWERHRSLPVEEPLLLGCSKMLTSKGICEFVSLLCTTFRLAPAVGISPTANVPLGSSDMMVLGWGLCLCCPSAGTSNENRFLSHRLIFSQEESEACANV